MSAKGSNRMEHHQLRKCIRFCRPRRRSVALFILIVLVFPAIVKFMNSAIENEEYTYAAVLRNFSNGSVLNPHPFKYVHTPSNVCTVEDNMIHPYIIILVKSDVTHFSYRMGIRSTWGNVSLGDIKLVFLLGFSSHIQNLVEAEYKRFHDIVQEDFIDAYRNNTIKIAMALNWAVQICQGAQFVLIVDDDVFVNIIALTQFLKENRSPKHLIAGFKREKSQVLRNIESKWYMTKTDFRFSYYPPYLSGGEILFSMTAAMIVQNALPYVKTIPVDDAYIGIVAYILNLKLTHDDRFLLPYVQENVDSCIAAHPYGSPDRLIQDWKLFLRRHKTNISIVYQDQMRDI